MAPKRIVYLLRSLTDPSRPYVGLTHNVEARLADHNAGRCVHTARYRPWQLHVTIELPDEQRAVDFERYLKSGSGAKRHSGWRRPEGFRGVHAATRRQSAACSHSVIRFQLALFWFTNTHKPFVLNTLA